jgi:hypothetical protein
MGQNGGKNEVLTSALRGTGPQSTAPGYGKARLARPQYTNKQETAHQN